MKNIKNTLNILIGHYAVNRGVGHTELLKKGTESREGIVVVQSYKFGRLLFPRNPTVTLDQIENLQGRRAPIAIDNYALQQIFKESLETIHRLEKELLEARSK